MARTFPLTPILTATVFKATVLKATVAVGLLPCLSVIGCSAESKDLPSTVVNPDEANGPIAQGGSTSNQLPPTDDPRMQALYEAPPGAKCGDGTRDDGEACDDGGNESGDGCLANCLVIEEGYECSADGTACNLAEVCGDGRQVGGEGCDDGNVEPNDGCSATCQLEADFICPVPGEQCQTTVLCGDGLITGMETCDDGPALANGDGCNSACQLEEGWACPDQGAPCTPICGDSLIRGTETCDDGNSTAPGCDANCRLEPGFFCETPGAACVPTVCGDGEAQGSEQCDDGNLVPYDGCGITCINEPKCSFVNGAYTCAAVCGDGMQFPEEQCDDGNTTPGDGCSDTCALEPQSGFECTSAAADLGNTLDLPIVLRDFPDTHPQFEIDPLDSPRLAGMVLNNLGPNGKPAYNPAFAFNGRPWTLDGAKPGANGAATLNATQIATRFQEWYTDVPGVNDTIVDKTLQLNLINGSFVFSATGATQFFPIGNNEGFGAQGRATNFHFTSEVRQWFLFDPNAPPPVLSFTGDDDVWVFLNGQLTVDLGGIHGELQGSITINEATGAGNAQLCVQNAVGAALTCGPATVPISSSVNEIVVFQAERHVTQSNYTLTLRGFNAPVSTCGPDCGNGIRTPDEACDDGENNGAGYGFCTATCRLGPRCGDGQVNGPEECDNGVNRDAYEFEAGDCAPGCLKPAFCGDGVVDGRFGEACDDTVNDGSYGTCNPDCSLGPRCGDGEVNGPEECDDGNRRNTDGCNLNCEIERQVIPS